MLSAGHGPLFTYCRQDDRFAELNSQALPLGILPSFASEPPAHLKLGSGDLLVLATDGFFEWENDAGEEFGLQRMKEAVRQSSESGAADIIANLYKAVTAFSNGTPQKDDLTAVVIKRL
jgi:serine phosphatase RsbU (regulator of sigma subunit)